MTDEEIYIGIANKDNRSFTFLQEKCQSAIIRMVEKNSGNKQDALDVFQEGLVAVWININQGKYQLRQQVKISTYIQQICRNIWLSKLRKRKSTDDLSTQEYALADETHVEESQQFKEVKLLQKLLSELNDSCQILLKLFYYQKLALKEIALKLNVTEKTAKNNKYRCMQKLRELYKHNNPQL
jgi:RNA polymerase sigma factor (sigma-70 family)